MPPYPISPMTSTSLAARCPGTPPHPQRSAGQWGQPHPVAVRFGVRLYLRNVLCGYALAIAAPRAAPPPAPPPAPAPPATSVRREGDCEAGSSQQESRRNEHRHNNESSYLNN